LAFYLNDSCNVRGNKRPIYYYGYWKSKYNFGKTRKDETNEGEFTMKCGERMKDAR